MPGGQVKGVLQNSNRVNRIVTQLDDAGRLSRMTSYLGRANDLARAPPRLAGYHLSRGLQGSVGLSREAGTRVLASARTTAQKYRIAEQLRRLDPRTIERLSPGEQTRLGQFLARYGDDGGRLMADGGEDLRRLIVRSDGLDEDTTRDLLRAHGRGDVSDGELRRISNALDEGDLTQAEVRRTLDRLRRLTDEGGIENPRIRLGSEANHRDPYYTVRYADDFDRGDLVDGEVPDNFRPDEPTPGYDPPHDPDGLVIEAELSESTSYYRAHRADNRQGTFMSPQNEFQRIAAEQGREGLRSEYALQNGVPDYITQVTLPEGETVRISTVGRQSDDLPGGGTQIEARRFPSEMEERWFDNTRDLEEVIED